MPKQATRLLEDPQNNEKHHCYKQQLLMLFSSLHFSFFQLCNENFEKDIVLYASTQKLPLTNRNWEQCFYFTAWQGFGGGFGTGG